MSNQPNETETGNIEVSRVINAPAERIYNAFLDADALEKFSPPAGYTARYDHVEPEVGGTYRGTFTALETRESQLRRRVRGAGAPRAHRPVGPI